MLTRVVWGAVSNEELRGATREGAAQVLQWVNFADSDIVPPASTWVFPTLGIMHYNKQVGARNGPQMVPKWGENGQKWAEMAPKWAEMAPKWPLVVTNGDQMILKWPEMAPK